MSKPTEMTTFTLQLAQLLRGEGLSQETPELVFARRLLTVDLSPRSRIETSLRARLLTSKSSPPFPRVPSSSPKPLSPLSRLAPTLAFSAAMILLVWFLAWVLTNTTPQPAINATETRTSAPVLEEVPETTAPVLPEETPTEIASTDETLTVLQTLTAKYASAMLSGSGWLHITKRIYVNGDSGALPNPWLADDWYFWDDQKQVVQAVRIQADENGIPVQVKVLRDRQWVHLTQDTPYSADSFIPNLDSDFVVEATNALANGSTLQMSDFYFDGQFVGIRFSYLKDDVEIEGIFDKNTGQMLSFTGTFIEDQEKQIIYSITVITQERTPLPPANILAYLDQALTPHAPLPPIDTPSPGTYTVQDGDTLSQIASDFGLTVETLIALNGLSPEAPVIFPGMVLIIVSSVNAEPSDLAQSDLTFEWTFTGNAELPDALADIYAGDLYLGQVDFGKTYPQMEPGGLCTRSGDGKLLAFSYDANIHSLRWFSLDDVTQVQELPVFSVASFAFSPIGHQLILTGCGDIGNETGCAMWRFDPLTGEAFKLHPNGGSIGYPPRWSPDGKALVFLPWQVEGEGQPGIVPNTIIVINVENGTILYQGYAYAAESPLITWGLTLPQHADPGTTGCESAP
jgi:LysM repeat protein